MVGCVIPALVIVYLDGACLEQWVAFWGPCSPKHRAQFSYSFSCPGTHPWCPSHISHASARDVVAFASRDLCRPQRQSSVSRCTTLALLRLQDMWLSKWLVTGLLVPAGQMIFDNPEIDPVKVSQHINHIVGFAVLISGSLPMLVLVLLIAIFSTIVCVAASWVKGDLLRVKSSSMVGTGSGLVEIVSVVSHLAFAYGSLLASSTATGCSLFYLWRASKTR